MKLNQISDHQAVLRALSKERDFEIRINVAINPATDPATLDRLSKSRITDVRVAVAHNPSTSYKTLKRMIRDEYEDFYIKDVVRDNLSDRFPNDIDAYKQNEYATE